MKSPLKFIPACEYRRSRWKNGGGQTAEIAVFPPGASLDHFGWRVSLARVETDGAFSVFPGIDRTLCVVGGVGMHLDIDRHPLAFLDATSPPHGFPADIRAFARLAKGPVEDLNVMTRRGQFRHRVTRHAVASRLQLQLSAPLAMLICQSGCADIGAAGTGGQLVEGACVVLEHGDAGPLAVDIAGQSIVLAVEIWGDSASAR